MTDRLYYTDSYRTTFTATIAERLQQDGKAAVILDRTLFYPTSGGQPHDTGLLDGCPVQDVIAATDGRIIHVLEGPLDEASVGGSVTGEIDWPRRYDHMQQHSGQHLLSHIFNERLGVATVSVHFGADESTIDLETATLTESAIAEVEAHANRLVYDNLPIKAYFVDDAGIAQLPLRRPPKVSGQIRIVEIDSIDYVACGGTHCRRTGELGPVKILRQERSRGNVRITFKCGQRALRDYQTKHDLLRAAAERFSTDVYSVPAAVERLQAQVQTLQREIATATEQLLQYEMEALLASSEGKPAIIARLYRDKTNDWVKQLAQQLQRQPQVVALLGTTNGQQATIYCARSEEISLDVGQLLRATLREVGGGGGGRPEIAQGGGIPATSVDLVFARLRDQIADELRHDG